MSCLCSSSRSCRVHKCLCISFIFQIACVAEEHRPPLRLWLFLLSSLWWCRCCLWHYYAVPMIISIKWPLRWGSCLCPYIVFSLYHFYVYFINISFCLTSFLPYLWIAHLTCIWVFFYIFLLVHQVQRQFESEINIKWIHKVELHSGSRACCEWKLTFSQDAGCSVDTKLKSMW